MNILKIFFQFEFLQLAKVKQKIFSNILYFFIFLSIVQILTQNFPSDLKFNISILAVFIAILSSLISINQNVFDEDFRDGTLEQILIHCQNLEIYIMAKLLTNWVSSVLIINILATVFIKMNFAIDLSWLKLLSIFLIQSLALNFLLGWSSALCLEKNLSVIASIVAVPLTLPIFILSSVAIIENFNNNILLLLALASLTTIISILACAKIINIVAKN